MPRILSARALRAILARETDEVFLVALTITATGLDVPIRVVCNTEDIVSQGEIFVGYPFTIVLPQDAADVVPQARIQIDNVDQEILASLRAVTEPPQVTIQIILASTPDVVEVEIQDLSLREADYDAQAITGTLAWDNPLNEKFPAGRYTPATTPGLFG